MVQWFALTALARDQAFSHGCTPGDRLLRARERWAWCYADQLELPIPDEFGSFSRLQEPIDPRGLERSDCDSFRARLRGRDNIKGLAFGSRNDNAMA